MARKVQIKSEHKRPGPQSVTEEAQRNVGEAKASEGVVGADNEYIPKLLGWETAKTMQEALEMAKGIHGPSMTTTMMHTAPMLMADCRA